MTKQIIISLIILIGISANSSAQKVNLKKDKNTFNVESSKIKSIDTIKAKEIKIITNEKYLKNEVPKIIPEDNKEVKPISKNKFFKYYIRLAKGDGNLA